MTLPSPHKPRLRLVRSLNGPIWRCSLGTVAEFGATAAEAYAACTQQYLDLWRTDDRPPWRVPAILEAEGLH